MPIDLEKARGILLVGPHGAGKSAVAAKLAHAAAFAGLGVMLLDARHRIAWQSPRAGAWLQQFVDTPAEQLQPFFEGVLQKLKASGTSTSTNRAVRRSRWPPSSRSPTATATSATEIVDSNSRISEDRNVTRSAAIVAKR